MQSSIWASEIQNLDSIEQIIDQYSETSEIPAMISQAFLRLQLSMLPRLKQIFINHRSENEAFAFLANNFPTQSVESTNWTDLRSGIKNLRLAMQLALPYHQPPEPEDTDLQVRVSRSLIRVLQEETLVERVQSSRNKLTGQYGFPFPQCTFRDDKRLTEHHYSIDVFGRVNEGVILPDLLLAISPTRDIPELTGFACTDPIFGLPAVWISQSLEREARNSGLIVLSPLAVLLAHIERVTEQSYHLFFSSEILSDLIERNNDLATTYLSFPKRVLLDVFRNLLRSNISIAAFDDMLKRLKFIQRNAPPEVKENSDYLFVNLRMFYPPPVIQTAANEGKLDALVFTENTANLIMALLDVEDSQIYVSRNREILVREMAKLYLEVQQLEPVFICPDYAVPPLIRAFHRAGLRFPLLMASEIPAHVQLRIVAPPLEIAMTESEDT